MNIQPLHLHMPILQVLLGSNQFWKSTYFEILFLCFVVWNVLKEYGMVNSN